MLIKHSTVKCIDLHALWIFNMDASNTCVSDIPAQIQNAQEGDWIFQQNFIQTGEKLLRHRAKNVSFSLRFTSTFGTLIEH